MSQEYTTQIYIHFRQVVFQAKQMQTLYELKCTHNFFEGQSFVAKNFSKYNLNLIEDYLKSDGGSWI